VQLAEQVGLTPRVMELADKYYVVQSLYAFEPMPYPQWQKAMLRQSHPNRSREVAPTQ
jgi:hypothetical protein